MPFELHPETPEAGLPLSEYFRMPVERVAAMQEGLSARAADLGLEFRPPEVLVNTRKAHIMTEYARDQGRTEDLVRAMFHANFVLGLNLADEDVLRDLAVDAGLEAPAALSAVQDARYAGRVNAAEQRSRALGITGVPAFIVEQKYKIVGAHPYEALCDALRRIAGAGRKAP